MVETLQLSQEDILFVLPRGGQFFKHTITRLQIQSLPNLVECARLWPEENEAVVKTIQNRLHTQPQKHYWLASETAYFTNLPPAAKNYALPAADRACYERYGADGLFHAWAASEHTATKRLISIHLCANTTLAAIENGKPIDTSAGYSALEGLPGLTTCGDIDPSLVETFNENGLSAKEIQTLLYEKSGWQALTEQLTFDELLNSSSPEFALPRAMFTHALFKTLGAMLSTINSADMIFVGCEETALCRSFFEAMRSHFAFAAIPFQLQAVQRETVLRAAWQAGQVQYRANTALG